VVEQGNWLNDTRTLVRSLLGAQQRFAVELDDVGTAVRTTPAPSEQYLQAESLGLLNSGHVSLSSSVGASRPLSTLEPHGGARSSTPSGHSGGTLGHFPPGRLRRPQSAMAGMLKQARPGSSLSQGQPQLRPGSAMPGSVGAPMGNKFGASHTGPLTPLPANNSR
jgi:hypothetical protein